jgi:hypothetical protein
MTAAWPRPRTQEADITGSAHHRHCRMLARRFDKLSVNE